MTKHLSSQTFKRIKLRIYNSYHNATLSDIISSLIVGSYIIIDDIFIPQSTENTIRKTILIVIFWSINFLRLVLSIKSGKIVLKNKKERQPGNNKTGDGSGQPENNKTGDASSGSDD